MTFAIIMGVLVFLIGQVLIKLFIHPVFETKLYIAETARDLIYYKNVYADPGNRHSAETESHAYTCLREHASQLVIGHYMIPCYAVMAHLFHLPTANESHKIRKLLIDLSNNVYSENKDRRSIGTEKLKEIRQLLKIQTHS